MGDGERGSGELNSWKEIGSFLGVNVRTAQRWEAERGMPVRRFAGDKGRVAADTAQLLAWQQKSLHGRLPPWRNLDFVQRYAIGASAAVLLLTAALLFVLLRREMPGTPVAGRFEFRTLVVSDVAGHELWRHNFPEPFRADAYRGRGRTLWFGDIDGDGSTETVFAYHPEAQGEAGTSLICFGADGGERWRFTAGRPVSDQTENFDGIYEGTDFAVADFGPRLGRMAVITSHHVTGDPNQVALIDGHGKVRGEYWHSGHLDSIAISQVDDDGVPEVLLAGVDGARQLATLVVLDAGRFWGASDGAGTRFQLRGLSRAREKAVLWFPRTCVNRLTELYNVARNVRPDGDGYDVYVQEQPDDGGAAVIYTLARDLSVMRWKMTDRLLALHAALRRQGRIDHDFEPDGLDGLQVIAQR